MPLQKISYGSLPSDIRSIFHRIDLRSRHLERVTAERELNRYTVTLKSKHRLGDQNFELDKEKLRYLYRSKNFISIENSDRNEGLTIHFTV